MEWSVQQCSFQSTAKVIPLAQYDLIVDMDWLSSFSPMQVDWKHKWLKIPYDNSFRVLQGDLQELPPGTFIQVSHVAATSSVPPADNLPPEISQLLQEFISVFDPPQGYPPRRDCEHDIPLLQAPLQCP